MTNEIVGVDPGKAEGTPVPGAGFSPEAVPGNEQERRIIEPLSESSGFPLSGKRLSVNLRQELAIAGVALQLLELPGAGCG